jgi:hypothetical protein
VSILLANITFADEKIATSQSKLTPNEIVKEIAPFVDEDTVLVCYVNCAAMNNLHKLSTICSSVIKTDDIVGLRVKNILKQMNDYWQSIEKKQQKGYFSELLESNIDHFYIIFNLKYLHLGAFYVVPSVNGDMNKIKIVKNFFDVQDKKDALTWTLVKDNYLIVGGKNIALSYMTGWFRSQERMGTIYSFASLLTDDCCQSLGRISNVDYRKDIFKNYTSKNIPILKNALKELESSNAIKVIILNTGTSAANEFLWCKNMKAPINEITLDFICTSRKYIVFGVDTDFPSIKICIQTDSHEKSENFRHYLTTIIHASCNNYFELPAVANNDYEERIADKEEWTKFIMLFIPPIINDKLEININDNFFQTIVR